MMRRASKRGGTTIALCVAMGAAATLALFACADGDDPPNPLEPNPDHAGSIEVVLQISGSGDDADGCTVTVDAGEGVVLLAGERHSFTGMAPGEHKVVVSGIAPNCTLVGEASRTVSVIATLSTPVLFQLDCQLVEDLGPGSIEVTTVSAGSSLDPDGYTLVFEGTDYGPIGLEDTVTLVDVPAGLKTVGLSGVASSCYVAGGNPVSVGVSDGQSTTVAFDVLCPPFHDYIAYVSSRSGDLDIWLVKPDGSSMVNLTRDAVPDDYPTWSPDGTQIVYERSDGIYILDTSDLTKRLLTSAGRCPCTWAPDGSRIAYTHYRGGPPGAVYAVDADGSNVTILTQAGYEPAWSPDGGRIAFCRDSNGNPDLWLMDPDGSQQVRITNLILVQFYWRGCFDPAWSPNGSRIAFAGPGDSEGPRIWGVDSDGTNLTKLTADRPQYQAWRPSWSPDGSRIAFWARQGSLAPPYNWYEIYVMDADGSNETDITNRAGYDVNPSWAW